MSREVRRVPLDFNWPIDKVWDGYLNPFWKHRKKCHCDGSGLAPEAKRFSDQWYGNVPFDPAEYGAKPLRADDPNVIANARRNVEQNPAFYRDFLESERASEGELIRHEANRLWEMWRGQWVHHLIQDDVDALVKEERLWDFTRVPRTEEQREIVRKEIAAGKNSWMPESNGYTPTADEVNAWSLCGMGHDGINQGVCVEARCKREDVEYLCPTCKGSGDYWPSLEAKKQYDKWEKTDPPTGDGWQLWETVSEGSPQSPVFSTEEEFVNYLVKVKCYSKKAATAFAQSGWAPSLVMVGNKMYENIESCGISKAEED